MPSLPARFTRLIMSRLNLFGWPGASIPNIRQRIDKSTRWLPSPKSVTLEPVSANGVPGEWLIPPGAPDDRALLYFHGGAFCICNLQTHRPLVSALAANAGVCALSLDYRLAPEHPFPAALEDGLAAYRWLLANGFAPEKIVVGGDSAGGNLALALLLALRDASETLPAGAILLSPVTDLTGQLESRRSKAKVDIVLRGDLSYMLEAYIAGADPTHPYLSPILADLHGLPPLLFHVGSEEILLDDAVLFTEKACQAGVQAQAVVWPGMWHVFQTTPAMPEARQSIQALGAFVRELIEDRT
jgi:acetyl esterase/lipase